MSCGKVLPAPIIPSHLKFTTPMRKYHSASFWAIPFKIASARQIVHLYSLAHRLVFCTARTRVSVPRAIAAVSAAIGVSAFAGALALLDTLYFVVCGINLLQFLEARFFMDSSAYLSGWYFFYQFAVCLFNLAVRGAPAYAQLTLYGSITSLSPTHIRSFL